jgi:outer membrane protein TolC
VICWTCRLLLCSLAFARAPAWAQARDAEPLPSPLGLEHVLATARARRTEVVAARARARAFAQRPAIVSALEDPMITPSADHLPFRLHGADASLSVEQRFPLSRALGNRRRAAEADAQRASAEADTVALDVELEAASAFLMLDERRGMARILEDQRALAHQLVRAATARYASGAGAQADALRAEIEVARLDARSGPSPRKSERRRSC